MGKYLDEAGLGHLWGKIEEYVKTPIIPLTQAEYDALSEGERDADVLYLVTDAETPKLFPQGMTIYSEEETVIGSYNGKPLYRKIVKGTPPSQTGHKTFASSIFGGIGICEKVIRCGGCFELRGVPITIPIYVNETDFGGMWYDSKNDAIGVSIGSNYASAEKGYAFAILEYTKTTDTEGSIQVLPAGYVHSYDTEDGWHVRKYSDGYVEQTYHGDISLAPSEWSGIPNGSNAGIYSAPLTSVFELPVPMTEKFGETFSLAETNWSVIVAHSGVAAVEQADPKTHVDRFAVYRIGGSITSTLTGKLTIQITGRWK